MARKPLSGPGIANVQQHGTGAINVDACRVPTDWDEPDRPESWRKSGGIPRDPDADKIAAPPGDGIRCHPGGRWPPNVLLDSEAAEVLSAQSGHIHPAGFARDEPGGGGDGNVVAYGRGIGKGTKGFRHGDQGTAARFFPIVDYDEKLDAPFLYTAKASTAEREAGLEHLPVKTAGELTGRKDGSAGLTPRAGAGRASNGRRNGHPTVKPVTLLSWLVRLVTPPCGIVLDPFAGSGSCGIAATLQGFRYIGIELDPDGDGYVEIARARIRHWLRHGGTVPKPKPQSEKQQELFE
ncbi:MAG: site-specific DNA-methyltransferase [Gammaproteobacteria bacterium]|nr:site-specific DNA-methyltransferase [Gammaproteobacteria bacterium]